MELIETKTEFATLDFLKILLDQNKIPNELIEDELFYDEKPFKYIEFKFPVARDSEIIRVTERDDIDSIMSCDFVKYRGISDYEAIWSNELKNIECQVQDAVGGGISRGLMRRLSRFLNVEEELENENGDKEPLNFLLFNDGTTKVTIGYSSKEFAFLNAYKDGRRIDLDNKTSYFRVTIKIENVNIETEEEARKKLEKISNALFYQLSIIYDFCLTLSPRRESLLERKRKSQHRSLDFERKDLTLDYTYDEIPMSLYWFALNNIHSPIFMYFALYQALEFYFPIYATMNVKNKIQNLLKDPKFRATKDSDIMKILNVAKSNHNNNWGDEREQLLITLRSVVSGEEIIDFIKENEQLELYFNSKESTKVADKKIQLNDASGIVNDLAERIYDIRCRIVHNKASETTKKILPMTKNVGYLRNDVKLLKYIVEKVIIANSKHFSLE